MNKKGMEIWQWILIAMSIILLLVVTTYSFGWNEALWNLLKENFLK